MPVPSFNSLSIWLKIALVCLSLGVLLFVIGFATESWMVQSDTYRDQRSYTYHKRGLWRYVHCDYLGRYCASSRYPPGDHGQDDFHKATQAMECLGLICQLLVLLLLFLYVCVDQCRRRNVMLTVIFFTFAAVVFMVIGFVVFAVKYEDLYRLEVGWSLGVAIAGCILIFVAGVMCVMHVYAK